LKIPFVFVGGLLVSVGFGSPGESPRILIVPVQKSETSPAPTLSIANYLAQEFDLDGRVRPIVWSFTDPIFRDAEVSGKLRNLKDTPNKANSMAAAKLLGASYVLIYSSQGALKGFTSHADLYYNGREIWHDSENSATKHGGVVDSEDSYVSIAHTWNLLLLSSAFKGLTAHPKLVTPALVKGQEPPLKTTVVAPPPDLPAVIAQKADDYVKAGQVDKAINLVRDAIDSNPFDPKLRLLIVGLYEQNKDYSAAADAAIRGSEVIPDNLALRKLSLKDLIAAGRSKDAQNELNEILAREPNSGSMALLRAETDLSVGDYSKAALLLDQAIKKSPSPDGYYWRSLARAALGGADGVNADVQEYLKKPLAPSEVTDAGRESERILASITSQDIAASFNLFQQAIVHPDSVANKEQLDQLVNEATARSNFLQQIACGDQNKQSYGALLLAQKLLIASFASLREVLKTGSEDSMTDARINLGEAIKALKSSQKLLAGEVESDVIAKPRVDLL
jgi:tetratricopeptide (TPR) repeat protein